MQPDQSSRRPWLWSLSSIGITILLGLVIRFAHLGLPAAIVKYGGSTLWACAIYWVASALLPSVRILPVAIASFAVACGVEFLKLYRSPGLDAFRLTIPGILLLGRIFSWNDIYAYLAAIAGTALIDGAVRARMRNSDR